MFRMTCQAAAPAAARFALRIWFVSSGGMVSGVRAFSRYDANLPSIVPAGPARNREGDARDTAGTIPPPGGADPTCDGWGPRDSGGCVFAAGDAIAASCPQLCRWTLVVAGKERHP
ncbi:hypothetical protein GCM10028793_27620 [Nocardiopsis oceani]